VVLRFRVSKAFALGQRFERFIEKQLKGGRFNNATEVVQAGLRLLEDDEERRRSKIVELRKLVEEADRDPRPDVSASQILSSVKKGLNARSKKKKRAE